MTAPGRFFCCQFPGICLQQKVDLYERPDDDSLVFNLLPSNVGRDGLLQADFSACCCSGLVK